jgi:hypothetical protein
MSCKPWERTARQELDLLQPVAGDSAVAQSAMGDGEDEPRTKADGKCGTGWGHEDGSVEDADLLR